MKLSLKTAGIAVLILAPVIACVSSNGEVAIGSDCASGFCGADGGPTFTPPPSADGGGDSSLSIDPILACVGTTCPAPYASCSKTPSFLCESNLQNDPENCGACGNSCGSFEGINMGSRCVKGRLRLRVPHQAEP